MKRIKWLIFTLTVCFTLASCTFNPFSNTNHLTGNAVSTGVGAGIGAGFMGLAETSKYAIWAGGLTGGAIGYYVSTLRFASAGVIKGGGRVFALGCYVAIEIPTDRLFEVNSSDFSGEASLILDSVVCILQRYPYKNNNILISGNSSGIASAKFELSLSEQRASQVAAYLWAHGITDYICGTCEPRKLSYVGWGNYFPVANDIHNESIRQNSRIQITAYPTSAQLGIDKKCKLFTGSYAIACKPPLPPRVAAGYNEVVKTSVRPRMDYKGELRQERRKKRIPYFLH